MKYIVSDSQRSKMNVLVIDGYNIIGAWDELEKLKRRDISEARDRLLTILTEYQAYSGDRVIVVFDALYVKGLESKQAIDNLEVIFTKEKETADECIERLVKEVKNVKNQVYVATSDYAEQRTIFGRGALRISARELLIAVRDLDTNIAKDLGSLSRLERASKTKLSKEVLAELEKMRRGKK